MDKKIFVIIFVMYLSVGEGEQPSNYDLSRQVNKVNSNNGFGLRDIWDFLIGAGYGYPNYNYPNYPSGPGLYPGNNYPGSNYPGSNYPGSNYPGGNYPSYPSNQVAGPPGAHPGCPLCDSSVYSYCSHKQAHDSCCCENQAYLPFSCRKSDCKFLYANSCQEYQLISSCCCVDLQKNSIEPVVPVAVVGFPNISLSTENPPETPVNDAYYDEEETRVDNVYDVDGTPVNIAYYKEANLFTVGTCIFGTTSLYLLTVA